MTLYIYTDKNDITNISHKDLCEVFESVGPCKVLYSPVFAVVDYFEGKNAELAFEKF